MLSFHPDFEQNLMVQEALKFRTYFYDISVACFNHNELLGRKVSIAWDRQQMDLVVNDDPGEGADDFTCCYVFHTKWF